MYVCVCVYTSNVTADITYSTHMHLHTNTSEDICRQNVLWTKLATIKQKKKINLLANGSLFICFN